MNCNCMSIESKSGLIAIIINSNDLTYKEVGEHIVEAKKKAGNVLFKLKLTVTQSSEVYQVAASQIPQSTNQDNNEQIADSYEQQLG